MRSVMRRYLPHSAPICSSTLLQWLGRFLLGVFWSMVQKNLLHRLQLIGSTISSTSATLKVRSEQSVVTVLQYLPSISCNDPKHGLEASANRVLTAPSTSVVQA